jgi:membrane protein implicated in regulation of membrane protease activity
VTITHDSRKLLENHPKLLTFGLYSGIIREREVPRMKYIWFFGAVAAIYGAIAASFLDNQPYIAIAFGLLALVFALAAWRDLAQK